ncbi:MAG: hypothetical protein O8C66_13600 [Candidatus Methanoperedens sp.]|nr:hypothetical protein [Candidatus Methanoperedens sp.]MCZ7371533.1 hypothetical protein [Candidatus Methanoperedens sp.]
MKALSKNEQAQAGVGTLIIFIAMVLVAAVAAAVLIQTSGTMQSKSTSTTKEAAAAIGENINVESIDGVAAAAGTLNGINITIRPAAGSSQIDLSKVLLKMGTNPYSYSNTTISGSTFRVFSLRDPSNLTATTINTYSGSSSPALGTGALVRLDADVSGLNLVSKASVTLTLTPEKGNSFNLQLTLPAIAAGSNSIYP